MKLIRRFILILTAAVCLCCGVSAFEIQSFNTTITADSDNCYSVSETILIDFTGSAGAVTRVIPLTTPSGKTAKVKHLSITGSKYKIDRQSDRIVITLGEQGSLLAASGYAISYKYQVGYDFDESKDSFSFQLIDAHLGASVKELIYTISMPAQLDPKSLTLTSGYYGKLSTVDYTMSGNVITGILNDLMAYESMDVDITLPNEYFQGAAYRDTIADGIEAVTPYLTIIILFVAMTLLFTRCKNPMQSIEASGEIPEDLTPADMIYLINGTVSAAHMTSLIPFWATKGYLLISDSADEGIVLTRATPMGDERKSYERLLFDAMFPKGSRLRLNERNPSLQKAVLASRANLAKDWKAAGVFKPQNRLYPALAMGLPLVGCLLSAIACGNGIYRAKMAVIFMLIMFLAVGVAGWAVSLACGWLSKKQGSKQNYWGFLLGALWMALLVVNLLGGGAGLLSGAAMGLSMVAAFVDGLFMWDLTPRTDLGLSLLKKSLSFRDYVKFGSDADARAANLERDAYFYEVLPYAGVFSLENRWADKFLSLRLQTPRWFETEDGDKLITPLAFLTRLEERMRVVKLAFTGSDGDNALTFVYLRAAARNISKRIVVKFNAVTASAKACYKRLDNLVRRHRDDDE